MSYTSFGEFMRTLRVKNHEIMGDTAKLFNCMISFVSSVENGKKNVPETWGPIIIDHYKLDEDKQKELYEAIEDSKAQVKLNLSSASIPQRKLAVQFQRSFENLDDETANVILNLLKEDEN